MTRTPIQVLFIVSILLVAAIAPRAQAPATVVTGYETRITLDPGDQYDSSVSGDIVVFTDYRTETTAVYYVDLATMTEHPVIVAPGNQELTDVDAGWIVYTDYRTADVIAFNTLDGSTANLTHADKIALGHNFNAVDPAIAGTIVAWVDSRDGNLEIYAMDLASGEKRRVTDSPDLDIRPAVGAATIGGATVPTSTIVWERCVYLGTCDIWSYDWDAGTTTQITNTPAANERMPNTDGARIVYQSDRTGDSDICLFDLTTHGETCLALGGDQANPHVSGDNVSLDDLAGGVYHVTLWHVPTGDVFQITNGPGGQYLNAIDGNRIVYTDDRNGDLDIYMFTFTLQSADTTPPAITLAPACPATVTLGSAFTVDVEVTDEGSGVKSQTVPNGALALATATVGPQVLTISATDNAGNTATGACRYQVVYDFAGAGGFAPPVADQPAINSAKAGGAVPVKFQLPDGRGGYIADLAAVTAITFGQVADFGSSPATEIEAPTAGASGLRYDSVAQQFVFTWKTDKAMAGQSYMLVLRLNDGEEHYANFKLK